MGYVIVANLAIGGFDAKSPYANQVSMTRPYLTTKAFVSVPQGQDAPADIAGVRVSVEAGSEEAGLLEKTDAVPVLLPELGKSADAVDGPAVLPEWLLDDVGFTRTDVQISVTEHVLAIPMGENGWLTTVEDFLLNLSAEELDALLDRAVRAEAAGEASGQLRITAGQAAGPCPSGAPRVDHHRVHADCHRAARLDARAVAGDEGSLDRGHSRARAANRILGGLAIS